METTPRAEHIDSSLQTPCWYQALTLEERKDSWIQSEQPAGPSERIISEQARNKLQRWKEQAPFAKGAFFSDRLAMDNISEQDLLTLLNESVEELQQRIFQASPPDWLVELCDSLETASSLTDIAHLFEEAEDVPGVSALLIPFSALIHRGRERFQAAVTTFSLQSDCLPNPESLFSLFLPNLARQMLPQVSRVVVLEMNIARLRGLLQGDTPQARFHEYLQHLGQPKHLQTFLQEYCILARQLIGTIDRWIDCSLECLHHLCQDWDHILATFKPEHDPGHLTNVAGGAGDTHRNGHSVMILTFRSGWRLVYKPRSLGIDAHFQELLVWLNTCGDHPAFRTLKLLDKQTYGWVEYIADAECASEHEIRRFYERQGGYLALLYVLNAVDFHAENIIAAGEHPVLIDLEALFHPHLQSPDPQSPAQQALTHSVLGVSLLPQRSWSNEEFAGVDISGLGQTEGQLSSRLVAQWEGVGTDEMKVVFERVRLRANKNSPRLQGKRLQALDYLESITTGFTSMYRLLMEIREEFITDMLLRFAHDEIRFIARATRTYAFLLNESFHPNILRDGLKRERFFDRLWIDVESQPALRGLIPAERADLFRGDIPLFTTSPTSCDLFTSQGNYLQGFFSEPAVEQVKKRLNQLGEADLQRQIWIIRAAFTSTSGERSPIRPHPWHRTLRLTPGTGPSGSAPLAPAQPASGSPFIVTGGSGADGEGEFHHSPGNCTNSPVSMTVNRECFIEQARTIGDRLCVLALQDESGADWIGLTFVGERDWNVTSAGIDLYSGLPGIILFLSYLGKVTGETRYILCAQDALKTLRWRIGQIDRAEEKCNIGAFNGLGSCIYLFSHLASRWNDRSLLREAEQIVELLPAWIPTDDQFDLLDGSAGCILSLLSLATVYPSDLVLATAIQCGDHLLACAQPMDKGKGWKSARLPTPLTGLSRGTAGIALSLLKLASASGEQRFRQAAIEALHYERSQYSREKRNWLDLRSIPQIGQEPAEGKEEQAMRFGMSWGHGAPGIALARLGSLSQMDDDITRCEIDSALTTLLAEGTGYDHEPVGPNHSLAHGDCGNLESLLVAAQILGTPQLHTAVEQYAAQVLADINRRGWQMGVPLNVETPGLMLGLAGIGYQFLRLSEPDRVPSNLLLTPPVDKDQETGNAT